METSESMPNVSVGPPELVALAARPGPFVTVYVTTDAEIENAQQRSQQRWKTLRADLLAQGAPEDLVATIDPLIDDSHLRGQCLSVVLAADGTRHVAHHPDPPDHDIGRWGPLPALGPLLEWRQQAVPHVVVVTDRRGADLLVFGARSGDSIREVGDRDDPVSKSAPGGWSQRRYQQRAENTWEENAKDVADEVTRAVDDIHARLVVVAGDVRAVQLLRRPLDRPVDE